MAAAEAQERKRPKDWDKWVSAAYLRMLGASQLEAAKSVGRAERTIWSWEQDRERWLAARAEARERWMAEGDDAARASILQGLRAGNSELGKWWLERTDPKFAPPKQRIEAEVENKGGVLIVPGVADLSSWAAAAEAQQRELSSKRS